MGHPPADACVADRLAVAARHVREARVDDVRAEVEAARAAAGGALGRDDAVLAGVLLATAYLNVDRLAEASRELATVQPLLPDTPPLRQARYHAIAGSVAHGLGNEERAISELIWALALVDENQPATEELARVLGNCSGVLARTQLFTLGVDAGERAMQAAIDCGIPAGLFQFRAGAANLAWAIRLEHLRLPKDAREKWQAAAGQLAASLTWSDDMLTPVCMARTHAYLGLAAARLGDPAEARRQLATVRTIEITEPTEHGEVGPLLTHLEGATLLAEGRADAATRMLAPSWPEVRDQHQPPWTEDVAFLLARAAEATHNNRDALRWYGEVHKRYGQAEYEVALARAAAARLAVDREALVRRSRQLESDRRSDPLTGVANRRALDEELRERVPGTSPAAGPTTLIVVDVDHFKRINDECGHLTGDEVLLRVARLLRQQVRDGDLCARFGGDEFVLLLTATLAEAGDAAARLSAAVAGYEWATLAPGLTVTVTCGLAQSTAAHTPATLFAAADADLLAAKRARHRRSVSATASG
jgi:diguanylate cyclase (GGDEF)-like protein